MSVIPAGCAKTAEWNNVRFGVETHEGPGNVLDAGFPIPRRRGEVYSMRPSPDYFGQLLTLQCVEMQSIVHTITD